MRFLRWERDRAGLKFCNSSSPWWTSRPDAAGAKRKAFCDTRCAHKSHMYVYIYIHIFVYVYVYAYVDAHVYVCMYVYVVYMYRYQYMFQL